MQDKNITGTVVKPKSWLCAVPAIQTRWPLRTRAPHNVVAGSRHPLSDSMSVLFRRRQSKKCADADDGSIEDNQHQVGAETEQKWHENDCEVRCTQLGTTARIKNLNEFLERP